MTPVILNEAQQSEESLHYEKDFSKSVNRKNSVLHKTSMMFLRELKNAIISPILSELCDKNKLLY